MKILCLAGYGSSGQVLAKQTQQLRKSLPESNEYVFCEGEIECARHPLIPASMPGPFYCWYNRLDCDSIRRAHDFVHEVIEEEGPFDGALAFSQGAAVILSMLMDQEFNNPKATPLFSFAIISSSPVPCSPDINLHRDKFKEVLPEDERKSPARTKPQRKKPLKHRFSLLMTENQRALVDEYVDVLEGAKQNAIDLGVEDFSLDDYDGPSPSDNDAGSDALSNSDSGYDTPKDRKTGKKAGEDVEDMAWIPRLLHPLMFSERITIPTVHIFDPTDPYHRQFEFSVRLGDKFLTRELHHSGGHGLPTKPAEVKAVVDAIRWAVEKGRQRVTMF